MEFCFYFKLEQENNEPDIKFKFSEEDEFEYSFLNPTSIFYKRLFSLFDDENGKYAVDFDGNKFVPNKTMCVRRKITENGENLFFLNQFGVDLYQIYPNFNTNPFIMKLILRNSYLERSDLIVDIQSVPDIFQNLLEIDICVDFSSSIAGTETGNELEFERKFYKFSPKNWKDKLSSLAAAKSHVYYVLPDGEKVHLDIERSNHGQLACGDESRTIYFAKTYMRFELNPIKAGIELEEPLRKYVVNSFKHELTNIGKRAIQKLKMDLKSRSDEWKDLQTNLVAPIVSLCQSSGYGKSKIAIELLKSNPGFFIVFRDDDQTGYPFRNRLSSQLYKLVQNFSDTIDPQNNNNNSSIGSILYFFLSLIETYIVDIVKRAAVAAIINQNDEISETALKSEIFNFGNLFENNDFMEKFYDEIIKRKYSNERKKLTVLEIANEITKLLSNTGEHLKSYFPENPENLFANDEAKVDSYKILRFKACKRMELFLTKFPFIFVLDEVDILSKLLIKIILSSEKESGRTMTGFEALRRALSYLENSSNLFFLTLGTKSTIIDINPPVIDISSRYLLRKKNSIPILLSSNVNIFAEEYPIGLLEPSVELLTNPVFFKFLTTLGRGLWGSYPFHSAVNSAVVKLKNGSNSDLSYFLPAWMILTSFAANPLHSETSSLVAKHMATLLDISDDMKRMAVCYPSEPILALASMKLITDPVKDNLTVIPSVQLFKTMQEKFEGTVIDRGEMSESFVALMILRALASTPNCAKVSNNDTFASLVTHIKTLTPEKFHQLWDIKANLLEVSSNIDGSPIIDDRLYLFPDEFPAHTVKDFLSVWTGNKIDFKDMAVADEVLGGIVNATHFIRLNRDDSGFKNNAMNVELKPSKIPSADNRLADKSRNVIDKALLSYGLLKTCGFFTPSGSYGIDLVLPVCLKGGGVSMIAIQVKTSQANFSDDTFKMQARLNYVKCPKCPKFTTESCPKCVSNDELQNIFFNQISLLVSLDDEESMAFSASSFRNETRFHNGNCSENDKKALNDVLRSKSKPSSPLNLETKSEVFFKPLIRKNHVIADKNLVLSTAFWADEVCEMKLRKSTKSELEEAAKKRKFQLEEEEKRKRRLELEENFPDSEERQSKLHKSFHLSESALFKSSSLSLSFSPSSSQSIQLSSALESVSLSPNSTPNIPDSTTSEPEPEPEFCRDGMYHRQFTICSYGWAQFKSLFQNGDRCAEMAKQILTSEGIFRKRLSAVDSNILRSVVHDVSPTYFEYSDDLLVMRSLGSKNLDSFDRLLKILPSDEKAENPETETLH